MDDSKHGSKSIISLVLGCCGIVAWIIPLFGFPVTIAGLILGIMGMKSNRRGIAIAGVVLSILFLILTIGNSAVGAYMGAMRALQQ